MSTGQDIAPEHHHVCYVHCNFCSTILAVSVPRNCLFNMVTVRCGHCTNLLSVNMAPLLHQPLAHQDQQVQNKESIVLTSPRDQINLQSSVTSHRLAPMVLPMPPNDLPETSPIRPPEKRQRVPSAYNKFIKEEIQRIKASNPEISHREAFSAAAKNWAHLPRIHKRMTFDETSSPLLQDAHGFH